MADRTGQELGNYRLIRLLGRGGFAEVYLGEHMRLKTQAAIKVLYAQLDHDNSEEFLQEAQTVAHLIHPNIVRIFDFDVKEGVPFLVMDYAPSGTLRQRHPKNSRLSLETIIPYIKQVADALQYAHDEKFIHRDIKPENMLIGRRGEILLSDFGIALIAQSTRMQSTQAVMGTAYYMAPEQLRGKPRLASDQYALGVVVYEWLTGTRPFSGSFSEIASQHMFVSPPPLREKLPTLSPAIEEIVMITLAKDPHQRFGSVRAFANALEQARQPSDTPTIIRPSKHLSAPLPTIIAPTKPEQPSETIPPMNLSAQSEQLSVPSTQVVLYSDTGQSSPITAPAALGPISETQTVTKERQPDNDKQVQTGQPLQWLPLPVETAIPQTGSPERAISRRSILAGIAGVMGLAVIGGGIVWYEASQKPLYKEVSKEVSVKPHLGTLFYRYRGHSNLVDSVAWSSDGKHIASGSADNTVQVWDATNGENVYTYTGHFNYVNSAVWSPDGKRIASASWDGTVQVWDATNGRNVYTYKGHSDIVMSVAWSPDGQHIASASADKTVQVWDATNGGNVYTYKGHSNDVNSAAWSPGGKRIVSASADKTVQVWNATNGGNAYTYTGHSNYVNSAVWSPDGKRIASASADKTAQVWNATDGRNLYTYKGHSNFVDSVAWSPDGQHIVSGSDDKTAQIWDAFNLKNVYIYRGHSDTVFSVVWSPNGQRIASGSADNTAQVWQAS